MNARSMSSTLRTPKPTVAASKLASANGKASRSPRIHSMDGPFRRARSSIASEKSSPVGLPPTRAHASARSPVPQHASSTSSPSRTTASAAMRRQRRSSPAVIVRFITS
jgi:hypothetical protein